MAAKQYNIQKEHEYLCELPSGLRVWSGGMSPLVFGKKEATRLAEKYGGEVKEVSE